jgi:putative transposase
MRTAGIRGDERRRGVTTTKRRRGADVAPDLVHRVFHAERPNALWVSDLTYVRTTEGMADVCFVVDATSRMIVGWQVASQMTVQTVLRALEVARLRRGAFHAGLSFPLDRAHSDAGSQPTTRACATASAWQRSAGFPPSVHRDSDDNARLRA